MGSSISASMRRISANSESIAQTMDRVKNQVDTQVRRMDGIRG